MKRLKAFLKKWLSKPQEEEEADKA